MVYLDFTVVLLSYSLLCSCYGVAPSTADEHNSTKDNEKNNKKGWVPVVLGKWSYGKMNAWGNISNACSVGNLQSPISLAFEHAVTDKVLIDDPLTFKNYDRTMIGNLTNDGNTVVWKLHSEQPDTGVLPSFCGSGYGSAAYILDHLVFHWGSDNVAEAGCRGSEHIVEYSPAPLEVQFVHINTKYESFNQAQYHSDGIAALAFLFKIETNASNGFPRPDYEALVNLLPTIAKPDSSVEVPLSMAKLFPIFALSRQTVFFRYHGSQTMPPCFEGVSWTVYNDRIPIPLAQLRAIQSTLKTEVEDGASDEAKLQPLINNYRPMQLQNKRRIATNGKGLLAAASSSSNKFSSSVTVCLFLLVLAIFKNLDKHLEKHLIDGHQ